MALIDVVSYNGHDSEFVWKFPSDDLRMGTQVVVNTSQTAFLVKGGELFDQFESGTHKLTTSNIPLLNKLINIPFGGKSPFKAEVWYINLISKLDCKWGTPTSINLEDPKYGIIVPVRAFGQYGIKIKDPRVFLETLVGNMSVFSAFKILEYFKGKVISSLTSLISQQLVKENVSVLEINAHLDALSVFCQEKISEEFGKYGIEVVNFFFVSINIPEDDESIKRLKEAKDVAARMKVMGKELYQMDKSFDIMEKAASNEGVGGTLAGAGVGLGVGMGMGSQIGNIAGHLNTNPQVQSSSPLPPPLPNANPMYYLSINNQQAGPYPLDEVKQFIINGNITAETLAWKAGMPNWVSIGSLSDFASLLTPPSL
jgi:Putative virion core protein (lumpy skin disease virus)